ncbi:MAG: hypothetical protein K6C68_05685 [Ruminococcus sp.]|nr:hypothetical protein [Ruminococcus sp.]
MKRIIALILSCAMLFTGCAVDGSIDNSSQTSDTKETSVSVTSEEVVAEDNESYENSDTPVFLTMNDPDLQQYVTDAVYTELVDQLGSDDYQIESIQTIYMPDEYYADLEANSKENVYFGFTESELDEIFQGTKYVFTLDENGQTIVQEMEVIDDDTYDQIVKNVAVGTGVILVCVTISIAAAGIGAPAVSVIFAASAENAASMAASSAVLGGVSAAVVKGVETRNVKETLKASAHVASEGFKWGAISGAVVGGVSEGFSIAKSGKAVKDAIPSGSPAEIGKTGESYAQKIYNGRTQVSYLAGEEVPFSTSGATRPDIVRTNPNGTIEAIEVKNYDLVNNFSGLKRELERQVGERVKNLPEGSTQRIALITKGRGYSKKFVDNIVKELQDDLFSIYGGKIPIDIL